VAWGAPVQNLDTAASHFVLGLSMKGVHDQMGLRAYIMSMNERCKQLPADVIEMYSKIL